MQLATFIPAFGFFVCQKINSLAQISDGFREPTGPENQLAANLVAF